MALIASTQSDPMSYRRAVASDTISLSLTPGFSASAMSWYTPSTMAAAILSRTSSSMFFTSRAASIVCWPSRTSIPSFWQLEHQRRLDDVDAERHVAHAFLVEQRLDLARRIAEELAIAAHGTAQPSRPALQ
jgi:hypothetical protein